MALFNNGGNVIRHRRMIYECIFVWREVFISQCNNWPNCVTFKNYLTQLLSLNTPFEPLAVPGYNQNSVSCTLIRCKLSVIFEWFLHRTVFFMHSPGNQSNNKIGLQFHTVSEVILNCTLFVLKKIKNTYS